MIAEEDYEILPLQIVTKYFSMHLEKAPSPPNSLYSGIMLEKHHQRTLPIKPTACMLKSSDPRWFD